VIQQDKIRALLLKQLKPLLPALGRDDFIARELQGNFERIPKDGLIIDDEYLKFHGV